MNKLMVWYRKLKDLIGHGRTGAFIKGFLFVNFSVILGTWLGIKVFLPDDFILSEINERLFVKDMGLIAEDVDISLLGNISIYEGSLTEKGEKTTSFYELQFSPSFIDLMFGELAGTVYLDDINNQGGVIELSFETGENPCYSIELEKAPLSVLKSFITDISLVGDITGEGELCQNEKKTYDGYVELSGKDIVFRGEIPTQMGPLNIGKIELGTIELVSGIEKNILTVEKFLTDGLFAIDIAGKVTLNAKRFDASGLNLDVRIKAPDKEKLDKNPTLNLVIGQMSKFKKEKDNYAFLLKGRMAKPRLLNAPDRRVMDTGKGKLTRDKKDKNVQKNVKKNNRQRPKKRTPRKRTRKTPVDRTKRARPEKREVSPKKKKSLAESSNSTRKLEDDIEENKKEEEVEPEEEEEEVQKEEIEKEESGKEEESEKEEDEPEAEGEKEKVKAEEIPDNPKKEEINSEEDDDE